ncbi:hypothetical protein CJ739_646 [Mariniflexile rhizosphaerae]|uniref:hypothetical protein n=1 Tax=unclassified Mariniflexile TaxID=2643887 RepID=UPI000E32E83C|nr:hypothetical protein [Mariniflexile sp. TRM1-10]AXP79743.1 hypothetical protein CJ739_646 [Mariniflexile sp. TRM1-10]
MKEKELEYFYPYKTDKKYNYRALEKKFQNDKNYNFENDPYYEFLNSVSKGNEKLAGYISDDLSTWSLWNRLGRNIFSFSNDLLLMLEKTDVDDISFDMFSLPYDDFYLSLKSLGLYANSDNENLIDGVYVHLERSEMEAIPKSERDPKMRDDYYEPEYKLLIYFHFVGNFENFVKEKPDEVIFDEEIKLSWSYGLAFPKYEDFITVGDAIDQEIEKFESQVYQNFPQDKNKREKIINEYKDFVDKTIRVLINSLLYLSQPKEKINSEQEFPQNLPFNFNRKLNFAKTDKQKKKIEKKINETGFSKILYFGNNNNRNVNEYDESHRKSLHWRRGHWRKQLFGKDLQENKLIWIRPVLINKTDEDILPKGHVYEVKTN